MMPNADLETLKKPHKLLKILKNKYKKKIKKIYDFIRRQLWILLYVYVKEIKKTYVTNVVFDVLFISPIT